MIEKREEIKRILNLMLERKIPFIILRSYDFLNDIAMEVSSEIDILAPYSAYPLIRKLFFDQMYYADCPLEHCVFIKVTEYLKVSFDIQFEYIHELNMRYFPYCETLQFTSNIGSYPCLDGTGLLGHLLIHCLIGKQRFKPIHKQKIQDLSLLPDSESKIFKLLSTYFPKKITKRILYCLKEKKFELLEKKRLEYILFFLLKKPQQIINLWRYIIFKLKKKNNVPGKGLVVAFIGLDGVGKTTFSQTMVNISKKFGYKARYVYMGRVRKHILPMDEISKKIGISRLKNKRKPKLLYLLVRDLIYVLDMFLRYLLYVLPYKIFNYIVFCDRYAYDIYLDEHQTFLSRWFLKHLYPHPEILVFLQLPKQEIIQRKNEYSTAKREILMRRHNEVAQQFKPFDLISDNLEKNTFLVHGLIQKFWFEKIWLKKINKNEKKKCN